MELLSLRNRGVETCLRSQTGAEVDKVGPCYITTLNMYCVTGYKRLDFSRHGIKSFRRKKNGGSLLLDEIVFEQKKITNGLKSRQTDNCEHADVRVHVLCRRSGTLRIASGSVSIV